MDENMLDVKTQFVLYFLLFEMCSSNEWRPIALIQDATIGLALFLLIGGLPEP